MAMQRLYESWSQRLKWSSLHGRVFVFTAGIVLLLLLVLAMLINVVRRSEVVLVAGAVGHTDSLARSLAKAYEERTDRNLSFKEMESAEHDSNGLTTITAQVLHDEKGVEGGFYRSSTQTLGAYAFPTQEAQSQNLELPEQEASALLHLGAEAAAKKRMQRSRLTESGDIVVLVAYPACDTRDCKYGTVGAAWTMKRLPSAASDQRKAVLWGSIGFFIISVAIIVLAYSVLANVERSTTAVLARLGGMERDLAPVIASDVPMLHLFEFQTMLDGLERLGATLTKQINSERALQTRLHHSERLAAIGRLAAGIAHELRSPLATIRFRAQMAQRAAEEISVKGHCEVVLVEVDRLNNIIERLLAFSRPIKLHLRSFDLAALAEEIVERWRVQLPHISITSACLGAAPPFCDADESRMRQAFDNIVENAAHVLREEATPNPWIHLECWQQDDYAIVRILDNGGGFASEALQRGIEPFFTTRINGTGLGLAVTHEIVEAHRGTLTIENRDGEGATVIFRIPLQPVLVETGG